MNTRKLLNELEQNPPPSPKQWQRINTERDELLAALKLSLLGMNDWWKKMNPVSVKIIETAIAKVEGSK